MVLGQGETRGPKQGHTWMGPCHVTRPGLCDVEETDFLDKIQETLIIKEKVDKFHHHHHH